MDACSEVHRAALRGAGRGLEGLREDHLMMGSRGVGAGADPEAESTSSEAFALFGAQASDKRSRFGSPALAPPNRSQDSGMADQATLCHLQAMRAS